MKWLRRILHWAPYFVDKIEGAREARTGKQKAVKALELIEDAIGLADLETNDSAAAQGVRRGIKKINDGLVDIQNAVGGFTHAKKKKKN